MTKSGQIPLGCLVNSFRGIFCPNISFWDCSDKTCGHKMLFSFRVPYSYFTRLKFSNGTSPRLQQTFPVTRSAIHRHNTIEWMRLLWTALTPVMKTVVLQSILDCQIWTLVFSYCSENPALIFIWKSKSIPQQIMNTSCFVVYWLYIWLKFGCWLEYSLGNTLEVF